MVRDFFWGNTGTGNDINVSFVKWLRKGYWSCLSAAFDIGGATMIAIRGIESGSLRNGDEDSQGNGIIPAMSGIISVQSASL